MHDKVLAIGRQFQKSRRTIEFHRKYWTSNISVINSNNIIERSNQNTLDGTYSKISNSRFGFDGSYGFHEQQLILEQYKVFIISSQILKWDNDWQINNLQQLISYIQIMQGVKKREKIKYSSQLIIKQFKRSQNVNNLLKIAPHQIIISNSMTAQRYQEQNSQQLLEVKRKSFQDFLQSQQSNESQNFGKKYRNKQNFDTLAISYDNKIKPIHHYSKSNKQQFSKPKQFNNYSTNYLSPINKINTYYKILNNRRIVFLPNNHYMAKEQKFKGFNDCMKPVKYSPHRKRSIIKEKKGEGEKTNFECRPWTGRRQREQQSDHSSHILNSKC